MKNKVLAVLMMAFIAIAGISTLYGIGYGWEMLFGEIMFNGEPSPNIFGFIVLNGVVVIMYGFVVVTLLFLFVWIPLAVGYVAILNRLNARSEL